MALLYPEFSNLDVAPLDLDTLGIVLGFGFIFVSGFALLPAMIVVLLTEAFSIRGILAYAVGGAICGRGLLSRPDSVRPGTMHFEGIVRRHLEIMTGAGVVAGFVYWLIAGRNAGAWRKAPADPQPCRRIPPRRCERLEKPP